MNRKINWLILVCMVALLVFLSYTLLFSRGKVNPALFGMPYILWTGLLTTSLLVLLTFIGSRIFPFRDENS